MAIETAPTGSAASGSGAASSYLIPERAHPNGPLVAARLRRTALGFALVWILGLLPVILDATPAWKAFGLGILLPGAGFLYTSDPVFLVLTLVLFALAFLAWFGSGNILAPPLVWVGAAALASLRTHTGLWTWAEWLVPALLGAFIVLGFVGQRRGFSAAKRRATERNLYLAELESVAQSTAVATGGSAAHPSARVVESSEEDLAAQRYALDLALQPLDEFEGYDFLDQFQTAAVRYQLNFQQYGLALAHRTRTPAFTGYLAQAQRNLIEKMTNRKVWGFWRWENLWGNLDTNPDPIRKDNIMVSGYLGVMLGSYESNSADHRYDEPGSVDFRWTDKKSFPYDFHTVAEAVHRNFVRSPFGMFPCEPNWIYSACNTYGMNTLLLHDRLHGTDFAPEVAEKYRHSIDVEFLTADGRITAIRSSRLGLTIPMLTSTMADAGMVVFLNPSMPDVALRTWTLIRTELVSMGDDGKAHMELRGWDKLDVGNYKRSDVSPHTIVMSAAREMGDDEVYEALKASADAKFEPTVEGGARRYAKASTQANAMLLLGRFGSRDGFRDLIVGGPLASPDGPVLAEAPYPDVLVARATNDGGALDLVLRPGRAGGRFDLAVERLHPGRGVRRARGVARARDRRRAGSRRHRRRPRHAPRGPRRAGGRVTMALFRDAGEVYGYMGEIFEAALRDDAMREKVVGSGLITRIDYTDPESTIGVDFDGGNVYLGEAQLPAGFTPNMSLKMSADDGHRFWLGELNLTMAMAKGKVRAKGPISKMLKLAPLTKPLQATYRKILTDAGRVDLLEAS